MKICVFCSSKIDFPASTLKACRDFSLWLGLSKHTLVYGGARVGLMGVIADDVLSQGGEVEGYLPTVLFHSEIPHKKIQKLVEVSDLFERKRLMMETSDAFVILPGGIGTLDEFFEALTWRSLKCFDKPILLFNIDGFWNSLLILLNDLHLKGVMDSGTLGCFKVCNTLEDLKKAVG
jgi:uncharacterized protein (TIGR00730 family)